MSWKPGQSPFRVRCTGVLEDQTCGYVTLSDSQYDQQLARANDRWRCPHCMGEAVWDDDWYESFLEYMEEVHGKGFDESKYIGDGAVRVGCSQCAVSIIQGVPCHEHGCPNKAKAEREQDDD